jgi:hypothetical protein
MGVIRWLLAVPVAGVAYIVGTAIWAFGMGLVAGALAGLGVDLPLVTLLDATPGVGIAIAIAAGAKTAGVTG